MSIDHKYKDQVAIYLNEHPEFFNDYPELLKKIKAIDESELPIKPLGTLSIADRIIKRVHDDKEHLQSKLEWFLEIAEANEQIQGHLHEIERQVFSSTHLPQMVRRLRQEITTRFDIRHATVCLVDGEDHFIESRLQQRFPEELDGTLKFIGQETASQWFKDRLAPVLRGEVKNDSLVFGAEEGGGEILSEAIIPIIIRGKAGGAIALGSVKPFHFYEGLRTDYLERLADKLSLAIDNILLLDLLKRQPVLDWDTGFYNSSYLEPVLMRELDRAQRYRKTLSCMKMRIDYFHNLVDTYGESTATQVLQETGRVLKESCRASDILIRLGTEEFLTLVPEIEPQSVSKAAGRIRKRLESSEFLSEGKPVKISISIGVASYPDETVNSPADLVAAATSKMRDSGQVEAAQ